MGGRGEQDGRREPAVALAQQHRDVVGAIVGHGYVRQAILVEIPRHNGTRGKTRLELRLILERAVTVALQVTEIPPGNAKLTTAARSGRPSPVEIRGHQGPFSRRSPAGTGPWF